MRTVLIASAFALLLSASTARAEAPPLAMKALERLDAVEAEGWSYTKTTTSKKESRVERHDAARAEGERWSLLQKDGRAPSAAELRDYQREKAEERQRRDENPASDDDEDVDPSTIRLVSDTANTATFSFRVRPGDKREAAFAKNILGTLVVNKAGQWAERFELASTGEMRPLPGVKVEDFRLVLTFRRDASSGDILPLSIESRVRGRAFLVKSLDDDVVVQFSDFHKP